MEINMCLNNMTYIVLKSKVNLYLDFIGNLL